MVNNLFSKYIAYCRYTDETPVTWLLLKSEYPGWTDDKTLLKTVQC